MNTRICATLLAGVAGLWSAGLSAEPLTLEAAIERAVGASPEVVAGQASVEGARAGITQAGVRPNPVVTVEAEDFAGTGPFNAFEQSQVTLTYEQRIERGNKRDARLAYAARGLDLADAQARQRRLDVAAEVQRAFIDVQIADQLVFIAGRRLETERELQIEALRRVRGYRDPLFVETQMAARITSAELALEQTKARAAAARALLASYWGGDGTALEVAEGIEKPVSQDPALAQVDASVREAAVAQASAGVVLEQSRSRQDYTVGGGVRFLRETNDAALVASVSIPLGRFDRNQGNIAQAQAQRQRIEAEAEADRLARLRRLAQLRAQANAAAARADGLMHQVYPPPSRFEQIAAARAAEVASTEAYENDHPEIASGEFEGRLASIRKTWDVAQKVEAATAPIDRRFTEQLAAQQRFAEALSWASPALVAKRALEQVAGTHATTGQDFRTASEEYRAALRRFGGGFVERGAIIGAADAEQIPRFAWSPVRLMPWAAIMVLAALAAGLMLLAGPASTAAAAHSFALIHAYGGVAIGEHLGQLLTALFVALLAIIQWRESRRIAATLGVLTAPLLAFGTGEGLMLALGRDGDTFALLTIAGFLGLTVWLIATGLGLIRRG